MTNKTLYFLILYHIGVIPKQIGELNIFSYLFLNSWVVKYPYWMESLRATL